MIPLVRPSFPDMPKALARWRKSTDATGIYSNFGPLWVEAGNRLSAMTNMYAYPCSNGTEAVALAIVAMRAQKGVRYFDVEAFTFEATFAAAERFGAGFHSVIRSTEKPTDGHGVVRTLPFGSKRRFAGSTETTVLDAAGAFGFENAFPFDFKGPIAVSFHATKNFPIGEGGCVFVPTDWALGQEAVLHAMNFGFDSDRKRKDRTRYATNAKLDELHCAILLGQLDRPDYFRKRSERIRQQSHMIQNAMAGLSVPYERGAWQSLLVMQHADPDGLIRYLASAGFVARRVYCPNPHEELFLPTERDLVALPSDMTMHELELFVAMAREFQQQRKGKS